MANATNPGLAIPLEQLFSYELSAAILMAQADEERLIFSIANLSSVTRKHVAQHFTTLMVAQYFLPSHTKFQTS